MIRPVSPSVAKPATAPDGTIASINAYLSTPWSDYDRMTGRWYDVAGMPPDIREAVVREFRGAGWHVEFQSDQHDGSALVFKPKGADAIERGAHAEKE